MGKVWNGVSYNEDWVPVDAWGVAQGPKDWAANAAYAAANNTQNPYTNEAGASPYDKSGLIPGNESGSTLPRVEGTASRTPAYMLNGGYAPLAQLQSIGRSTASPSAASVDSGLHWTGSSQAAPVTYQSQAQAPSRAVSGAGSAQPYAQSQPYDYEAAVNEAFPVVSVPEGPRRRTIPIEEVDQFGGDDELSRLLKLLESGVLL